MKKNKVLSLSVIIVIIICIAFEPAMPLGAVYAYAEDADTYNATFDSIVNDMVKEPANYYKSDDPYGFGINQPFTMSPANELLVVGNGNGNPYGIPNDYQSLDLLTYGTDVGYDFLGSGTVNKNYKVYTQTAQGVSWKEVVNAPQTVSFDPTGSGRKDHVAELGVRFGGETPSLNLYVFDKSGNCSAPFTVGTINWMADNSDIDYYNVKNYYSVTAGDFNGDGKDSLIVYACLDNWGLGLYEIKVTSSGSGISISKVNTSPSYKLLSLDYMNGSDWNSNYVNVSSWVTGTTVEKKLCGQVASGDFNGDRIDDLAVLTWHGGGFVGSYIDSDPSSPYLAVNYGNTQNNYQILNNKACGTYTRQTREGDSVYKINSIAAPGLAAGDVNGDGHDEIIAAGYLKKLRDGDPSDGLQDVEYSKTVIMTYQFTEEGLAEGPNKLDLETTNLMQKGFYPKDKCMNYSSVASVALDGKGNPAYVFVNGLLAKVNGQSFDIYTKASGFDSGSYYNSRKDGFSNRWIDSAAVGNFDGDIEGTEEIVFSIGLKKSGKDKFRFDVGEIFGEWQTGASTQVLDYPMADSEGGLVTGGNDILALTFCSVDNDNDGIIARYKDKGYVYSDPEVMAVIQAAPYFDELKDYLVDTNNTSYSISESFELEKSSSNSVSFGVGATHNLAGTLGGYEVKAGYAMDWSEEFTKSQTTETTYTWSANFSDSVVVYRTPVILYRYEVIYDGKWDADHTITISVPGPASYQVISVEDYNNFAKYYNEYYAKKAEDNNITSGIPHLDEITDRYLMHEGDPLNYRKTTDSGYKLLQSQPQDFTVGSSNSTGFDYSKESGYSESETSSHGFSFELTITFGLNIPGFVESGAGGYTSLEYMHGNSVTTTHTTGKGVSCTVFNVDKNDLDSTNISAARAYGFSYQMASWSSNLEQTNGSAKVPVFGYVLSGVKAGPPMVDELELQLVTSDESEPNLLLTWADPSTAKRNIDGYKLYLYDEDGDSEFLATLSKSQTSYTIPAEGNYKYKFALTTTYSGAESLRSAVVGLKPSQKTQAEEAIARWHNRPESYSVECVSTTAAGTTVSLTNNTSTVSSVVFIVAAYNRDGKMITANTMEIDMAVSESINLTVSYKATDNVSVVKAFVVQKGTMTPLREAWTKEMAA